MDKNFWKHKKLSDFTEEEWEAVCLRCGKCCLSKSICEDMILFSNQMCCNFDFKTGKCSCYQTRLSATCAKVNMHLLQTSPELLPETCAYRLLLDGKDLPDYHPLISGDPQSVHKARKTVLEMPEVYSINELVEFAKDMRNLPPDEAEKRFQRYELVYVEKYRIPPIQHN